MTTDKAARRLNLAKSTVIDYCRLGTLAAEKHGRDWWIEPEEIERYQRERRRPGRPNSDQDSESADSVLPNQNS